MQFSGKQEFIKRDSVSPGEIILAKITLSNSSFFKGKLSLGLIFEFKEGPVLIGIGRIIEILNPQLNNVN